MVEGYIDSNFNCQVFEERLSIVKDYQFWDPIKLTQSDTLSVLALDYKLWDIIEWWGQ